MESVLEMPVARSKKPAARSNGFSRSNGKIKVPAYLVKESFDGVPLYYKGYEDVLSGKKTLEEIMSAGGIHSTIVFYLSWLLGDKINSDLYWCMTGEVGAKFNKKYPSMDLAIFDRKFLTDEMILSRHLPPVPPKIDIEVDVNITNPNMNEEETIQFRTQRMLNGGVEKVIWIFTLTQKIMVAEQGKNWIIMDWNQDVEIINGITFNIPKYFKSKKLNLQLLLNLQAKLNKN